MLRSLYSGISGMKANQVKMDVIGNNVANVSTTAFKKSSARFADVLYQTNVSSSAPSNNFGGVNGSQVGLGVKVAGISKNMAQGSLQLTARSTDLAVDGDGYFVVAKGSGTPDDPYIYSYTRDGSFQLDRDGVLTTADGYRVMSKVLDDKGNPTGELVPVQIPEDIGGVRVVAFNISVNGNGVVTCTLEDGKKINTAKVELATFVNPEGLEAEGGNRFKWTPNSGEPVYLTNGDSKAFGWISQGVIEMSNVDMSEEFTDMIITQRSFQATSKVITTSDELLQEIINLKR